MKSTNEVWYPDQARKIMKQRKIIRSRMMPRVYLSQEKNMAIIDQPNQTSYQFLQQSNYEKY